MRALILAMPMLLSLSLSAPPAVAAEQMRPGLWEIQTESDALRYLPPIPPTQLEQMRRMGIDVPTIQDNRIVTRVCISKEMAQSQQLPMIDKNETGCEMKNHQQSGGEYSADMVCDNPQMKGKGTVKGKLTSTERFESTYAFDGTVQGMPVKHTQSGSGKWMAADCGDVKPLDEIGKAK